MGIFICFLSLLRITFQVVVVEPLLDLKTSLCSWCWGLSAEFLF